MRVSYCIVVVLFLFSCKRADNIKLVDDANFQTTVGGCDVDLYNLESKSGLRMQVTNYGARVVSLWVRDKNGKYDDIVLGHNHIDNYVNAVEGRYFGSIVGRYAGRIGDAKFMIDDVNYQLSENNISGCIHGGEFGFDRVVWKVDEVTKNKIEFSHTSPDNDEGFPGELKIKLVYLLTDSDELVLSYEATSNMTTPVNLTNHSFFNLKGEGNGSVLNHKVTIYADSILALDSAMLPTGDFLAVEGTPFDFRNGMAMGDSINSSHKQIQYGVGYDHCWMLDNSKGISKAATVYEPESGRVMEVWTDQPGLQFYSSNNLHGANKGKNNKGYNFRESFAMETQKYPDSPKHSNFPSSLLREGEVYKHTCIYKFLIK